MAASIQSEINGGSPIVGASRNDLRPADVITLNHVGAPATTYAWTIAFKPEDKDRNASTATLIGNTAGPGPLEFTVDNEGSYLIRLVVDAGLPTESEQYVRLRALTLFGKISLVAAGERRDASGVIPVDVSAEGWANDQNFNLNNLLCLIEHTAASGRVIFVDANRGKDNNNAPNDPTIAEEFADFSTLSDAFLAATTPSEYNANIPASASQPVVIAVRPGYYIEDLTIPPYVLIKGYPGISAEGVHPSLERSVIVRCANNGGAPLPTHTVNTPNLGEFAYVEGIVFENVGATTNALFRKIGQGDVYFKNCRFNQQGDGAVGQGAAYSAENGDSNFVDCKIIQEGTFEPTFQSFVLTNAPGNTARIRAQRCLFRGVSIGSLDTIQSGNSETYFTDCVFEQVGNDPASFAIQTWATLLAFDRSQLHVESATITDGIEGNPTAAVVPGDLVIRLRRSVLGDATNPPSSYVGISLDDTNVAGNAILQLGSSEYGTLTLGGGVAIRALTLGTSLFYDNTASGLLAENVQDAIDLLALGIIVPVSLDAAYNNGRIIIVDSDAVELHGPGVATDPPPLDPENGDGTLRVYQQIELGAIGEPEILFGANRTGNGPSIQLGDLTTSESTIGVSAYLLANATGAADYINYNFRINAQDRIGDSAVGSARMGGIFMRAGTSLFGSGVTSPNGGSVLIAAGGVEEAIAVPGSPGDVIIAPGLSNTGPAAGFLQLVNPLAGTSATLVAGNNFLNAGMPAGTIIFATVSGRVEVAFTGGELWAGPGGVQELLSTGTGFQASWPGVGNPITLTSSVVGVDAEIVFIADTAAGIVNTALGDFSIVGGAVFTPGDYPQNVSLSCTAAQTITIGNGVNDLIYDAVTGKLTVPGVIDPICMVWDEVDHTNLEQLGINQGALFVSDGSGGLTQGRLYYQHSADPPELIGTDGSSPHPEATYLTVDTNEQPTKARRLANVSGQTVLTDNGEGSTLTIGLSNTAVVPGSYDRATVVVDSQGRITTASDGVIEQTICKEVPIPLGLVAPHTANAWYLVDQTSGILFPDGTQGSLYIETGLGLIGGQAVLDVVEGPPGGPFSSILTSTIDVGVIGNGTLTAVPLSPGNLTIAKGRIIRVQVSYTAIPLTGAGMVFSLTGQI